MFRISYAIIYFTNIGKILNYEDFKECPPTVTIKKETQSEKNA